MSLYCTEIPELLEEYLSEIRGAKVEILKPLIKQCLKGTETTRALRKRGINSIICGLSANNLHEVFENAGADHFAVKPFPVDPNDTCKFHVVSRKD